MLDDSNIGVDHTKKKKSRMEKYHNANHSSSDDILDKAFDVNPIVKKEKAEPKRQKAYESIIVKKVVDIKQLKKEASESKNTVFDIEDAFKNLKREHKDYDRDTQLEIMNDLFNDNLIEYNDIHSIEKDATTKKIVISEDDLIKMLDEKKALKEGAASKISDKIGKSKSILNVTKKTYVAPDIQPVVEDLAVQELDKGEVVQPEVFLDTRAINEETKVVPEKEEKKVMISGNMILGIVLVVLVIYLAYLIFQFFG